MLDGHMHTTLESVKLTLMLISLSQEEPQSPQLELPPHQPILLQEVPQLSTPDLLLTTDMLDTHMLTTLESVKLTLMLISLSQEEPQSPQSELSPPMLTELLSQLIPQLSPLPPLNILLPKEL